MNIFILGALGLCLGSFVNALVWRLSKQLDSEGNPKRVKSKELRVKSLGRGTKASNVQHPTSNIYSVVNGRSMCPNCKHTLAWYDLIPVFSWLSLGGKCRYCKKPISRQYPFVELLTSALFVLSYAAWPLAFGEAWVTVCFITWLVSLVGLVALAVYDIRYMLLPNRIIYPLIYITAGSLALQFMLGRPIQDIWGILGAIVVAAGIFWVLYQVSGGTWIGGGDSKLGVLAGLLLATPIQAFLFLFVASLLGLLYTMPLLLTKRLTRASRVPFGPFLIAALIVVVLWGAKITTWYTGMFTTY